MQTNPQAELAYNFVQYTNRNIFLTGKAGTGKTTFLHNLRKSSLKRMAIVAPTGVAAINAGGVTIHSFFQMPFGPYFAQSVTGTAPGAQQQRKFNRDKIKLIQSLDLLVIDEISMVRADVLDGIDEILRRYKNKHLPFGGVQLLMIGDLHQLSPIVKEDEWNMLKKYYANMYFFSSKALQKTSPACIELKHIYRQSDTHFIDILNKIRENKIDQDCLKELNSRFIPNFKPKDEEGFITLTTHNIPSQDINMAKLKEIKEPARIFKAELDGDFPEYSYPTLVDLELKVGAQVMFVKNDPSREKLYYNGKIGKITRMTSSSVFVKCPDDYLDIEVGQIEWQNIKYELNPSTKEIEEKVIGRFIQFPLKLAWAITIHKSQGLTFEKAIIDASDSFAHGQVYVALSRCKSFEGMVLRSPIQINSVKTDHTVSSYTKKADEDAPGEEALTKAKTAFQQSLITELFDFKTIKSRLFQFKKLIEENDSSLLPKLNELVDKLREESEKEIYLVSDTFHRELSKLFLEPTEPESNESLQGRIKKASAYFSDKIAQLNEKLASIDIETDNKAVKKTIGDAVENLKKEVYIKKTVLALAQNGFETIGYLKCRANAEIDFAESKTAVKAKADAPTETPNPLLYNILKKWRNNIAQENNVPVYIVLPTKVIIELVSLLPSTLNELETIKGIGKQKVRQYGEEILSMINNYCFVNKVERGKIELTAREEKIKVDTKKLSFDLYKAGKTIADIAKERGFSPTTIEGHLAHYLSSGEISLYELVEKDKAGKIIEYFNSKRPTSISEAKQALGDSVSYGELRAVMKHLETVAQELE